MDEFHDVDERRSLGTAHGELVRARDALKEAERFLRHTRLAKEPDVLKILEDMKGQVTVLSSKIKLALDAWDEEHDEA